MIGRRYWGFFLGAQLVVLGVLVVYTLFMPDLFDKSVFFRIVFILQLLMIAMLLRLYFVYSGRRAPIVQRNREVERKARSEAQDFVAQLSHEMRTPLTAIMGFVETVELDLKKQDFTTLQPSLEIIKESSRRLHNLCENILILSKEHRTGIVKETLYVEVLCKKELSFFKKQMAERRLDVRFEFEVATVRAKKSLFAQVFENLLSNAIRYAPEESEIVVRFFAKGDGTVMEIADRGPGIAQDSIEKIFDPFFRSTDETFTESRKGFGLGLAIVRKILFLHGGSVWVESELGQGTRFFCHFPD